MIEIGGGGLRPNPVTGRIHFDLVVRSRTHGQKIAPLLARYRFLLQQDDVRYRQKGQAHVLQQMVICSHFVNAVLYAAIRPGGTLATATDHAYDEIFKVSPGQMWREFMYKQGLWSEAHADFVGVHHKGKLNRNIDSRVLGVGLRKPPVPKKAGRPPLT